MTTRLTIYLTYHLKLANFLQIINNFVGQSNDSVYPYPNASKAFDIYNAQANFNPIDAGTYYFQFRWGNHSFSFSFLP